MYIYIYIYIQVFVLGIFGYPDMASSGFGDSQVEL